MKHNYFQDEKLKYEDIEIPDELLLMVRRTVAEDRRKKAMKRRAYILKTAGSVAAVLFLCLTIGVNSSYAFAETVVKIPIVKDVAQAVVMRSYRSEIIEVYKENKSSNKPEKKPEITPEEEPEEPVTAESGNDIPAQEEPVQNAPGEAGQEPVQPEELSGPDAWKAEMTPQKLREVTEPYSSDLEEKYADAPEMLRTILLADLPEDDISLYGYHEGGTLTGTALRIGDTHQYFEWNYMNETGKLPELSCEDINDDGIREVIVLLYNGKAEKKEIAKEEITAPEEAKESDAAGTADGGNNTSKEPSVNGTEGTVTQNIGEESGTDVSEVSGNDVTVSPESGKETVQPAGELWVISPTGETWTAAVLSIDDYESQILHQLKANYNAQTGEFQLYLMEEPFGAPIKLAVEKPDKLTYEAVGFTSERTFAVKEDLTLRFRPEAVLRGENGEKISLPLELELEAEIHLEEGSLMLENIHEL